ncbi:MAG: hypothetical protein ACSLFR_01175 [Solirubrobacteraceae bacterium]
MQRLLVMAAIAVGLVLSAAGPAMAIPSLSSAQITPADTTAGAHEDVTIRFDIDDLGPTGAPGDDLRDLDLLLPPGLVGDPGAAPECAFADLERDGCDPASRVGTTEIRADLKLSAVELTDQRIPGDIYLISTRGTEPARLGIVLRPVIPILNIPLDPLAIESPVRVRTAEDGGLTASLRDLPRTQSTPLGIAALKITRLQIQLFGTAGSGNAFLTNPTTCGPSTLRIAATTYDGVSGAATASFTATDCASVPFAPGFGVDADPVGADLPTAAGVTVTLPFSRDPNVRAQTQPRRAVVALPEGFELSPTVGSGGDLQGCSDAQFGQNSAAPSSCPAGAQIGTVQFSSPLVDAPLTGEVFLADPVPGAPLIRIFIVAEQGAQSDALRIKLAGVVEPDAQTGHIRTTLDDIPQLPFTSFELRFRGGQHAVVSTPRSCGTYTGTSRMTPHSGGADATPSATVAVAGDCPDPAAFTPSLGFSASPAQAQWDATITTAVSRPDRQARLTSMRVSLPPGILGRINTVPACPVDAARQGACSADSRVGTVGAAAGPGAAPLGVEGPVYLTESIDGSFAGLAIVVPAKVGPLDLGNSVTLAKLFVRTSDQGLDVVADQIPTRLQGVALGLRSLELRLDRAGFTFNATNCAAQTVRATLGSDLGAAAPAEAGYQATGCENVPFEPTIEASLTGPRSDLDENGHPGLDVTVRQTGQEANASSVAVTLPKGVAADPDRLKRACPLAKFEANDCPDSAIMGKATATTPLLPEPLVGNVVFVLAPGSALPQLRVQLRGRLAIDLVAKVSVSGTQLVNEFAGIPDVPLSAFRLQLDGGDKSPLSTSEDLCLSQPKVLAKFGAHSGKTKERTVTPDAPSCSPSATLKVTSLRAGAPQLQLRADGATRKLQQVRLKLPPGIEIDRAKARRLIRLQAGGMSSSSRRRARVTVYRTRLDVTLPGTGAQRINVLLRKGALRVGSLTRQRRNPRLNFRVDVSQPQVAKRSSMLRTRPVRSIG